MKQFCLSNNNILTINAYKEMSFLSLYLGPVDETKGGSADITLMARNEVLRELAYWILDNVESNKPVSDGFITLDQLKQNKIK